MRNLESVVHERNDAYFRLETGDGADPPMRTITSFAGFTYQFVLILNFILLNLLVFVFSFWISH